MTALHPHRSPVLAQMRMSLPRFATLMLLGVVILCGAIAAGWFAGEGTISTIFEHLNELQETPPILFTR